MYVGGLVVRFLGVNTSAGCGYQSVHLLEYGPQDEDGS
jgi:hypothetical protein